jgi:chromosome segregation protein
MRLKRLELSGFKSFADRTVMDFSGQQLTGIVGPNGCGKSNVVDAVRWVLGETRPTSMRGTGMTDVIFKGSTSRAPLSVAEVTMVLDNEGGELEERGGEVAITRRLYKDGEGEYLIDSERVRLKDVRDMLFGTGLGSRGYSVLEQGRIDAVLSANPVQRRAIFEEAAGISRYRQRRHETELRLKRVEQDVTRLDDVMGELRSRVRSLKIQAGKAERYVTARAEWTEGRTTWLRHRLADLEGELGELSPELGRLEAELERLRGTRGECEREVAEREEERSQVVAELDQVSTESGRLSGELSTLDERGSQLALRVSSWRASAKEETERAEALSQQLNRHLEERAALEAELEGLASAFAAAEETAGGVAERARELGRTYKAARQAAETQNEVVLGKLHERTAAQNALRHLEGAQGPAEQRAARAAARLEQLDVVLTEVEAETEVARQRQTGAEQAMAEADEAWESAGRERASGAEALAQTQQRARERELERAQHQARIDSLLDREAELASLSEGTRVLLEAVESGDGPCEPDQLLGILADHISIDLRLARALDVALGDRAQRLVAADAHVALDLLAWMQEREQGQVGLAVPRGIGAPDCPSPGDYALFARYGMAIEGRLCERVECDEGMRPLVRALLCDVVIVSDLDLALELVGREPGWRFVTPAGELVEASGVVGGYRELSHGAVGRRSSAADLAGKVDELDRRLEGDAEEAAELERRQLELEAAVSAAADLRETRRRELADLAGAAQATRSRLADRQAARAEHEREVAGARAEIARLEGELAQAALAREASQEAFETENARLDGFESERRGLEEQRDALAKEENRAQVEVTRLRGERQASERGLGDLVRRVQEDEGEIARSQGRARNYEANAEQGDRECATIADQARALSQERAALESRLTELRERERGGAQRIREVRERAEEVQRELDAAGERLGQARLTAQRLEMSREELLGRAHEELELEAEDLRLDFEADPELLEDGALDQLARRVGELREKLEKIGPVNVDAVHELEEVAERLEFLEAQALDLANARKSLNDTIAKIDAESRRLFLETFDEVRVGFQRIFRQLFGGGRADVQLEEGVDVLEAGIEIMARPPGREMLAIGLLSGGQRTMTALALLFAVFEARPSPFCVLDEVDAALDDANIDRFLGMLEGFVESSQFIVVTHNKGTMSACDALYGVTMQTKGVSTFVSVELDEVEQFAPGETTGKARAGEADGQGGDRADPPSGPDDEPIVELVPARANHDGTLTGGTALRVENETGEEKPV